MIKRIAFTLLLVCCPFMLSAQLTYGVTGLLHMPSAEMQKDKTFMIGGNVLHITPLRYFNYDEIKYTFNYFINITFFPWMEVGYTCTIN